MIEMYEAVQGIAKQVKLVDPSATILLRGMAPRDLSNIEEFLLLECLDERELPSQTIIGSEKCLHFQLTCYSIHAEFRADKKYNRPHELASKYKHIFHRANHKIKTSCIRMHDSRIVYLDLRSVGDSVKIAIQSNITAQLHCCVIQSDAYIQG